MITNISFNNRPQVSFGVIVGPDPSNQYNKNNDNSGDTFVKSEPKKAEPQKTEPKTKANAKSSYSPWQKGTALLGAFGLGGCVGAGAVGAYAYNVIGEQNAPSAYVIPGKIASAEDVEILAEYAGSSSDIVYDYNDADGIEQLSKKENVYIPYGYTGLEEKMAKLKDALASDGLDYQERLIAEEKVEAIQKFEQQQKEYVLAVKDDKDFLLYVKDELALADVERMFGVKAGLITDEDGVPFVDSEGTISSENVIVYDGDVLRVKVSDVKIADKFNDLFRENGFMFHPVVFG